MNTRRFVLHLIIGLLTFLIGVTAAIALGGFDPLARLNRRHSRYYYTSPPQALVDESVTTTERGYSCPYAHRRTADMRHRFELNAPPAPSVPLAPLGEEDVPAPPPPTQHPRHGS
jgi:hypothetical protein